MKEKGNESAYPTESIVTLDSGHALLDDVKKKVYSQGLTKREYFAGLAMQGMLANRNIVESLTRTEIEWVSEKSVILADALIEQLTKEG